MTKSALRGAHRHREQLSRETIYTKFEKRFTICETISEQRSNIPRWQKYGAVRVQPNGYIWLSDSVKAGSTFIDKKYIWNPYVLHKIISNDDGRAADVWKVKAWIPPNSSEVYCGRVFLKMCTLSIYDHATHSCASEILGYFPREQHMTSSFSTFRGGGNCPRFPPPSAYAMHLRTPGSSVDGAI